MQTSNDYDSFYPYEFGKSDKLIGMDARHGSIFMGILMDEVEGDKKIANIE